MERLPSPPPSLGFVNEHAVAKLNDDELYNFMHYLHSTPSLTHKDFSALITDYDDLARVLRALQCMRWGSHALMHAHVFGFTELVWQRLVERLVEVLIPGLYGLDYLRSSAYPGGHMPFESKLWHVPKDIFRAYQTAFKLLVSWRPLCSCAASGRPLLTSPLLCFG